MSSNKEQPDMTWKYRLNRIAIGRHIFSLYSPLINRFRLHYHYESDNYWTPIEDQRAQEALMMDDDLGIKR